jgi:hypothetical protein
VRSRTSGSEVDAVVAPPREDSLRRAAFPATAVLCSASERAVVTAAKSADASRPDAPTLTVP